MEWLPRTGRIAGRFMVILGLLVFYGSILLIVVASLPGQLYKAAAILAMAGCWMLIGALAYTRQQGRATVEAVLGFLSIPAALICLMAAQGGESSGLQTPWLIIAGLYIPAVIGLLVQAAQARRSSERDRNRPEDQG